MTMIKYLSTQGCPIVTMVNCWSAQVQVRFTMEKYLSAEGCPIVTTDTAVCSSAFYNDNGKIFVCSRVSCSDNGKLLDCSRSSAFYKDYGKI